MDALCRRMLTALVWALIPLTAVAGMPRISCVCPGGQHKLFCDKPLDKACCQNAPDKPSHHSCCHKAQSVQQNRGTTSDRNPSTLASLTNPGCTRFLVSPLVPTNQKVVSTPNPLPDWTAYDPAPAPMAILSSASVSECDRDYALPVPDLLIAHQVFLI